MNRNLEILNLVITSIILLYIAFRTYQIIVGNDKLHNFIKKHYFEKGLEVTSISRLKFTERIKYGVPISIFWFYSFYFGFLTGKIDYVRKVEIEKGTDSMLLKYVELQVRKKEVVSFKEFDSYEL